MLLVLPLLECEDDVNVTLVAFIVGWVVVIVSEPSCDAIIEVKVRLLGEELRTTLDGGAELELSLVVLTFLLLLPAIVTGLGGG
jgi:hypothetical protein